LALLPLDLLLGGSSCRELSPSSSSCPYFLQSSRLIRFFAKYSIIVIQLGPKIGYPWAMRICAFVFLTLLVIAALTLRSRNPPKPTPWRLSAFLKPLQERTFASNAAGLAFFSGGLFITFNFLVLEAQHRGMGPDLANYQISILNGVR
jgi:hypothetical protein